MPATCHSVPHPTCRRCCEGLPIPKQCNLCSELWCQHCWNAIQPILYPALTRVPHLEAQSKKVLGTDSQNDSQKQLEKDSQQDSQKELEKDSQKEKPQWKKTDLILVPCAGCGKECDGWCDSRMSESPVAQKDLQEKPHGKKTDFTLCAGCGKECDVSECPDAKKESGKIRVMCTECQKGKIRVICTECQKETCVCTKLEDFASFYSGIIRAICNECKKETCICIQKKLERNPFNSGVLEGEISMYGTKPKCRCCGFICDNSIAGWCPVCYKPWYEICSTQHPTPILPKEKDFSAHTISFWDKSKQEHKVNLCFLQQRGISLKRNLDGLFATSTISHFTKLLYANQDEEHHLPKDQATLVDLWCMCRAYQYAIGQSICEKQLEQEKLTIPHLLILLEDNLESKWWDIFVQAVKQQPSSSILNEIPYVAQRKLLSQLLWPQEQKECLQKEIIYLAEINGMNEVCRILQQLDDGRFEIQYVHAPAPCIVKEVKQLKQKPIDELNDVSWHGLFWVRKCQSGWERVVLSHFSKENGAKGSNRSGSSFSDATFSELRVGLCEKITSEKITEKMTLATNSLVYLVKQECYFVVCNVLAAHGPDLFHVQQVGKFQANSESLQVYPFVEMSFEDWKTMKNNDKWVVLLQYRKRWVSVWIQFWDEEGLDGIYIPSKQPFANVAMTKFRFGRVGDILTAEQWQGNGKKLEDMKNEAQSTDKTVDSSDKIVESPDKIVESSNKIVESPDKIVESPTEKVKLQSRVRKPTKLLLAKDKGGHWHTCKIVDREAKRVHFLTWPTHYDENVSVVWELQFVDYETYLKLNNEERVAVLRYKSHWHTVQFDAAPNRNKIISGYYMGRPGENFCNPLSDFRFGKVVQYL